MTLATILSVLLSTTLAIEPPAVAWTASDECLESYSKLWDWDEDETLLSLFLDEKLRDFLRGPCKAEAEEWLTWLEPDNSVRLFDTMTTWKHCAHRLEAIDTWEACTAVPSPECTSAEFRHRLGFFGLGAPPSCEMKAPECAHVIDAAPVGVDDCWRAHEEIQAVCGDLKIEAWRAEHTACADTIEACEAALVSLEQAEVGGCTDPYDEVRRACPRTVMRRLRTDENACVLAIEQEKSEACHVALEHYRNAGVNECSAAAEALVSECETVDYESMPDFEANSVCKQECVRWKERVSKAPGCRIADGAYSVCTSPSQLAALEDEQRACANARARVTKPTLYSSIAFGALGLGMALGGGIPCSKADPTSNPSCTSERYRSALLGITITGGTLIAVGISLGSVVAGLMTIKRPHASKDSAALRTIGRLVAGMPVRF